VQVQDLDEGQADVLERKSLGAELQNFGTGWVNVIVEAPTQADVVEVVVLDMYLFGGSRADALEFIEVKYFACFS
jgi:hypothetical protein